MPHLRKNHRLSHGITLVEMTFVMAILSGAFVAILALLNFIGSGMFYDTVSSDQTTRTTGTLYDIVSEVRDATAFSPNFYIEVNPDAPPKIIFDKVDGVDKDGNTIWGSKITYRLEQSNDAGGLQLQAAKSGVPTGRIIREEVFANKALTADVRTVEERVPYQFKRNGVTEWGFNITRNGSALTVTSSRFGDSGIDAHAPTDGVVTQPTNYAQAATAGGSTLVPASTTPVTSMSIGSLVISTATGTYFLKNPKVVIPAE